VVLKILLGSSGCFDQWKSYLAEQLGLVPNCSIAELPEQDKPLIHRLVISCNRWSWSYL